MEHVLNTCVGAMHRQGVHNYKKRHPTEGAERQWHFGNGRMRVIVFIQDEEVIKKTLKHRDLWNVKAGESPKANTPPPGVEIDYSDSQFPPRQTLARNPNLNTAYLVALFPLTQNLYFTIVPPRKGNPHQ
jgi:hypothetical protein